VAVETDFIVERPSGRLDKVQVKYVSWSHKAEHSEEYKRLMARTYPGERPKYDFLYALSDDGRAWEIPAEDLPRHSILLDSQGGNANTKGPDRWLKYQINTTTTDEKEA
jgi:hypothetical protein